MSEVVFTQIADNSRFYITSHATEQTARILYVLPTNVKPPTSLKLSDIKKKFGGVFCFVPRLPSDYGDLEELTPTRRDLWFMWIKNPEDFQPNDCTCFRLKFQNKQIYRVTHGTFHFHNSEIEIPQFSDLKLNEDEDGFTFTRQQKKHFDLKLSKDGQSLSEVVSISLCFPALEQGILQFDVKLTEGGLDALDVGLRTFWDAGENNGALDSQRYPVFSLPGSTTAELRAHMDPYSLDDSSRTYYAFLPHAPGGNPTIGSYYRTILGHEVALTAQTDASVKLESRARLLFAGMSPKGGNAGNDSTDSVYLVPSGDFLAEANNEGEAQEGTEHNRLVCGLSGVEYVILDKDSQGDATTTRVTFVPGQPAFAKGFLPDDPDKETGTELTDKVTTSWVRLRSETPDRQSRLAVYCAQPGDCVLYRHSDQNPEGNAPDPKSIVDNSLTYMEVPSLYLPAPDAVADTGTGSCFPMLPYSHVQGDPGVIRRLEAALISPTRKKRIDHIVGDPKGLGPPSAADAPADDDLPSNGMTPQGFLATYTSDFETLSSVLMATTDPCGESKQNSEVLLQNIQRNTPLWKALLSNQLFLVATDKDKLTDYLKGLICIEDWPFHLDPDTWRKDTILIAKFFSDKTLYDLAQDSGYWTHAQDFNKDVSAAESTLQQAIQYAINQCCGIKPGCQDPGGAEQECLKKKECEAAPDFEYFVYQVLLNPQWNGILAFNVSVPLDGLPDHLKCLAAGIDADKFFAHHVGITASPVDYDEKTHEFHQKKSSAFGLIYYDDPELLYDMGFYAFKVLTLKVLFQNTAISSFASRVDLLLNHLFGETVDLKDVKSNNLIFDGVYQDHGGKPSYVFTNQAKNVFEAPDSQVIKSVILDKGHFVTVVPTSDNDKNTIKSKFIFWGGIDFRTLKGFDAFSFGSDAGTDGRLALSNLAIEMDYDTKSRAQTFYFDPTHLGLDIDRSKARPTSLYSHFPLKLTGFLAVSSGGMPTDMGFMSVTSPLTQGVPTYPWYGLTFELELGSLGALAEKAGFTANLIMAWSPVGGEDYNVFLGLKLPGSSGNKKEISLEGLLKIKIKSIEFVAVPDTESGAISYMLRLQTISLGFLSLSFPPSGRTDFLLFGDPDATGDNKTLGWYAVYDKGAKEKPKKPIPIPGFNDSATRLLAEGGD